jgi:hypothetical protein
LQPRDSTDERRGVPLENDGQQEDERGWWKDLNGVQQRGEDPGRETADLELAWMVEKIWGLRERVCRRIVVIKGPCIVDAMEVGLSVAVHATGWTSVDRE